MIHLKLECIGERENRELRLIQMMVGKVAPEHAKQFKADTHVPWVARILGLDAKYGLRREFIRGDKWFGEASANWNRGVYLHYDLDDAIYEVHQLVSWKRSRRYFISVVGELSTAIEKEAVIAWANEVTSKSA